MENKNVLITGGSRGIGAAISRRFAKENFYVYINYKNDFSGAEKTAKDILEAGGQCEIIQFDVSNPLDIANKIKKLNLQKLDVLVNNAGISIDNLIFDLSLDDIERTIDTNFLAALSVFNSCNEMLKKNCGTVISIGSIAGAKGKVGQAIYAVSKAMIIEWTACMAELEKDSGLKFYCISPGPVLTKLVRSTPWARDPKAKKRIPMNRFIEPAEIGEIAVSLIRDQSVIKNGSNLFYDGGFLQTVKS